MPQLDDVKHIRELDSQDQFGMVGGLPQQLKDAYRAGIETELHDFGEVSGIAVAGMGGSAIGGDVVGSVWEHDLGSPMATIRGYNLPRWISSRTLLFAVSYSGNTEETISCLQQGLERGCKVICVTTGGKMMKIARERELPLIEVPTSLQPRAAMGWLSLPVAACLESLGLLEAVEEEVNEASDVLAPLAGQYAPETASPDNIAKELAREMYGKIPVIYGAELTAVAALRWKCQINENAKALAFNHQFPELNHNEIVGWERPADKMSSFRVIYLRDSDTHPQNNRRMEITAELLKQYVGDIREFSSHGQGRLARVLSSIYLGDFLSLYLAILSDIDPSPVERIENLKKRLA